MSSAKQRVNRLDLSRVDASGVVETGSGGLRIPARVTRTGVLEYHDTEGNTWGELRPADEVFAEDSLVTLKSAPVTQGHPGSLVTPDTWKRLAVGHAGDDVRRDGEFVAVSVCVQDAATLELVRSKELVELSCGYSCDLDETAGTFEGKPYTRIQRGIRYNHVALGPEGWGRAGSDVRLHLDSNTALSDSVPRSQTIDIIDSTAGDSARKQAGTNTMKNAQTRKDGDAPPPEGMKKDAEPANAAEGKGADESMKKDADMAKAQATIEALTAALADMAKQIAELKAEVEKANAEETAEGEVTEEMVPPAVQDSIASKRLALLDTARAVVGDSADLAGKSADAIKRAVIGKAFPSVKLDAKSSPETVETLYTAATEQHRATAEAAKRADAKRADANDRISKVLAPSEDQAEKIKRQDSADDEDPIAEQRRRLTEMSQPAKNTTNNAKGA
jgi:hypothetical protein